MFRGGSKTTWLVMSCALLSACGTVDLGDNYVAPAVQLDEDFFYCRIQPEVLTEYRCASGTDGEGGMCHSARSALRLVAIEEGNLPNCDDEGAVLDPIPQEATDNLEAIRFTVQGTPATSPLLQRPLGEASHPRDIFQPTDPPAALITQWISQGGQ